MKICFLQWISICVRENLSLPVSESLTFCTANSPGSLSNKKYARLENTVSSDHRFAAFGSRSRRSTLKVERKIVEKWWEMKLLQIPNSDYDVVVYAKKKQLKFIAQRIFFFFW
jgi:hypothetical protein